MKTIVNFKTARTRLSSLSLFLILICVSLFTVSQAQPIPKLKDPNNPFFNNKVYSFSDIQYGVIYWCGEALATGKLFTEFKSSTGLGNDDSFIEVSTFKDSISVGDGSSAPDFYHTLYQQFYKGIPVEGNTYTEHHDGEYVFLTSGFAIEGLSLNVIPSLTESNALDYATTHIDSINDVQASTWIWDSFPSAFPEGELVIIYSGGGNDAEISPADYKLAYKFTIMAISPRYFQTIYVDANSGAILMEFSNRHFDNGGFNHLYYGAKSDLDLKRKYNLFVDDWYLAAFGEGRNIYTTDDEDYVGQNATYTYDQNEWGWGDMPRSIGDTYWGNDNWSATAAHYCAQKSWDFFKQTYNRNGTTGWGKHIRILADNYYGDTYYEYDKNITHDVDYIWVGRFNNNYAGTYDVIGHEFTHGVIQHTSPLPYLKISGAINESFADIFGFMVERYVDGGVSNWTIGENALQLRDMQNTHNIGFQNSGQPAYYMEPGYWASINNCFSSRNNDFCYVHTNAGVQNRWFYLLSMGGSQNVNGQSRTVIGIGIDKAARIAFYTMTNMKNYDQSNLTFDVVRANSLASAAILYGYNSVEYFRVCQAWYAVNVGNCIPLMDNIPCSFTPNKKINEAIKSGLKENIDLKVKVALIPNPAYKTININIEEPNKPLFSEYQVNILDLQGKVVSTERYKDLSKQTIDISFLVTGVYMINITTSEWSKSIKFVKN